MNSSVLGHLSFSILKFLEEHFQASAGEQSMLFMTTYYTVKSIQKHNLQVKI